MMIANVYVLGAPDEKSPRSPRAQPSLSDSRAAYQEFLLATRSKQGEEETKEALFERVERKEEAKEKKSDDLEVQDVSLDEL